MSLPCFYSFVAAVNFGPNFLDNDDPEFRAVSLGEGGLVIFYRNVIVHYDCLSDSVFRYPDSEDAIIVDLLGYEKLFYSIGVLSQNR